MRRGCEATREVAPRRAGRARPRPLERAGNSSAGPASETASGQEAHGRCRASSSPSTAGPRAPTAEKRERWRSADEDARHFADLAGLQGAPLAGSNGRFPCQAEPASASARQSADVGPGRAEALRDAPAHEAPAGHACRHLPTTCRKGGGRVIFSHPRAHREECLSALPKGAVFRSAHEVSRGACFCSICKYPPTSSFLSRSVGYVSPPKVSTAGRSIPEPSLCSILSCGFRGLRRAPGGGYASPPRRARGGGRESPPC